MPPIPKSKQLVSVAQPVSSSANVPAPSTTRINIAGTTGRGIAGIGDVLNKIGRQVQATQDLLDAENVLTQRQSQINEALAEADKIADAGQYRQTVEKEIKRITSAKSKLGFFQNIRIGGQVKAKLEGMRVSAQGKILARASVKQNDGFNANYNTQSSLILQAALAKGDPKSISDAKLQNEEQAFNVLLNGASNEVQTGKRIQKFNEDISMLGFAKLFQENPTAVASDLENTMNAFGLTEEQKTKAKGSVTAGLAALQKQIKKDPHPHAEGRILDKDKKLPIEVLTENIEIQKSEFGLREDQVRYTGAEEREAFVGGFANGGIDQRIIQMDTLNAIFGKLAVRKQEEYVNEGLPFGATMIDSNIYSNKKTLARIAATSTQDINQLKTLVNQKTPGTNTAKDISDRLAGTDEMSNFLSGLDPLAELVGDDYIEAAQKYAYSLFLENKNWKVATDTAAEDLFGTFNYQENQDESILAIPERFNRDKIVGFLNTQALDQVFEDQGTVDFIYRGIPQKFQRREMEEIATWLTNEDSSGAALILEGFPVADANGKLIEFLFEEIQRNKKFEVKEATILGEDFELTTSENFNDFLREVPFQFLLKVQR